MGILPDIGPIQDFQQMKKDQKILKIKGVKQFLHRMKLYSSWKKPQGLNTIKWGQQIQGHFLKFNEKGQLQLCKSDLNVEQYSQIPFPVVYEYGVWMFEIIPKVPHSTTCNFYDVIKSIRHKYDVMRSKSRIPLTIPCIPFIGLEKPQNNQITQSKYIDDNHITKHPRFSTFTKSIRMRRGQTVEILVPVFYDKNTKEEQLALTQPKQGFIHMDAMAFGMGSCSLQCTFSTKNLDHARYVYDQLNVISPLFLALTAGAPFYKGKVSDWDVRWNIIADSVDDRPKSERDPNSPDYLPTSRYSYAKYYIWDNPINKSQYNDINTGVKAEDIEWIRKLTEQSKMQIDEKLIFHLANIFRRDYIMSYENYKQMDDDQFALFDMLNGTNWNSVRLKIPIDDDIGWRVQFRTMEVSLTADQNAAYSILIHIIARILHENQDLNFYIPISKLKENFDRAHQRDAVRKQKFYFRTNIYQEGAPVIEELTILEILFGKGDYKGIMHQVDRKLQTCVKLCVNVKEVIDCMKKFIYDTASGERPTLARWMREFVDKHPDYTHNSILSKKVMDDTLLQLFRIESGQVEDKAFSNIFPEQQYNQNNPPPPCYKDLNEQN